MSAKINGSWGPLMKWPVMGIHAIVTQDGKLMTFGTDQNGNQGAMMYHDIWDPMTGQHQLMNHAMHTPTDVFCSAAIILPGTNRIVFAGGDARPLGQPNGAVNDSNIYDGDTKHIMSDPLGEMNFTRWYATMVSLPDGRLVALGGSGNSNGVPEIYTPGLGWSVLPGARDGELAASINYPRAYVNNEGKIVYFHEGRGTNNTMEVMELDPNGNGSVRQIGSLPFTTAWDSPSAMYQAGKVLIQDTGRGLWSMDITGKTPVFQKVGDLSQERNWSTMTVMADGKVLITGGTAVENREFAADKTATIFDPSNNTIRDTIDEANPRLYHSTLVLLPDATMISLGGGAAGGAERNYLDGQIYKPPYLFDNAGNPAARPEILSAPSKLAPGSTFRIDVTDAASIQKLTFVKTGAVTHALDMEGRHLELSFTRIDADTVEVKLPVLSGGLTAGSWMLFAWNSAGAPSVAKMVAVDPVKVEGWDYDPANLLVNGTLDHKDMTAAGWQAYDNNGIPGWKNAAENYIELVNIGKNQALDLDARSAADLIYQDVRTESGRIYKLGFDVIRAVAGTSDFDVLWNGAVVATVRPGNGFPQKFEFEVQGTGGADRLGFREYASQNNNDGAYLDNVVLKATDAFGPISGSDGNDNLVGTERDDVVEGRDGDDLIEGKGGNDTMTGGKGNDTLDGGTGTDTASYEGKAADYRIEKLADGSFRITGPNTGADILKNVERVFFTAENKAYDPASLVVVSPPPLPPELNPVQGTAGDDYLLGTDGKDVMTGGKGVNVFEMSKGDDLIDGEDGDYNQVNLQGAASEYTVTRLADGSLQFVHPVWGTDVLKNVDGVHFYGEGKWYDPATLVKTVTPPNGDYNVIEGTDGFDYLQGADANDKMLGKGGVDVFENSKGDDIFDAGEGDYSQVNFQGKAAEYTVTRLADGSLQFVHPVWGTDILKNIDGAYFDGEAKWYDPATLAKTAPNQTNTVNGADGDDYLLGTDGNDRMFGKGGVDVFENSKGDDLFDGGTGDYAQVNYRGKASDYMFQNNADGSVTSTSAEWGTDTLVDIDGIRFDDGAWYNPAEMPSHIH